MVPTIPLKRKYPLGTTGTVNAYLPVELVDQLNGGTTPRQLRSARLTQNTDAGYAEVTVTGVPSTLYTHLDVSDAYIVWGEDLMFGGFPTATKQAYQTPVPHTDPTVPFDIDDPTNPLFPVNAGDVHYGILGVEVIGTDLSAYIHLGKLILQLQADPNTIKVGAQNSIGDSNLTLSSIPLSISTTGGTWVVIAPYTVNCTLRQIVGTSSGAIVLDRPLTKQYSAGTSILFTQEPQWWLPWFGAAGGGTVNDTPAWEAAKADVPAVGGTIRIPHGVWRFNAIMNQQGLRVVGDAKSSVDNTYPNYILPWDISLPVIHMMGANSDQVHDMVIRDIALYGSKTAATGLWIDGGVYNCHIDQISCINFIDHCLKIGDLNQTDLVSKIHINGAVLQPSDTNAANVVTLGLYGNTGSRYTTAVFINNMELQQPPNGHGIVCDGAPNNYISNSYIQIRDNHCLDFRKTGSRSFPHIYMDNVAIDNGDTASGNVDAISINLIAGTPLLPSYLSGTYKVVGKITNVDHTYSAPANMAAAIRDPLMLELWVLGGFRLADVNNPEFASAPNMIASGANFQLNTFSGGGIFLRPNNRDTYALRILANTGPVLPTFLQTAKPDANLWPGSLIQVSNEAGGAPIEFSTPRTYTLTLAGAPTGGYFTITVVVAGGSPATTIHLSYNATASEVQAALQDLTNIGDSNVTVKAQSGLTGGSIGWVLTPAGTLIGNTVAFTFDISNLTGGSGVGLTYITTVGVWEQVASRNRDNGFLVGQGMRAGLSASVAAGLYVPWITGDTVSTLYAGRNDTTNNQTALRAMSGSGTGAWGESITGDGLFARSQNGLPLRVHSWNDVVDNYMFAAKFFHRALGALPLAGIGTAFGLYADTTNSGAIHADDLIYHVVATHPVATTSAFTGDVKHYATDYGHSWLGWEMLADGALKQGWFGKAPVVQQASAPHASDLTTVIALANALAQGLISFGLFATNTGFSAPSNAANSSVTDADPEEPLDYDPPYDPNDNHPAPNPDQGGGAPTGYTPDVVYTGGQ